MGNLVSKKETINVLPVNVGHEKRERVYNFSNLCVKDEKIDYAYDVCVKEKKFEEIAFFDKLLETEPKVLNSVSNSDLAYMAE